MSADGAITRPSRTRWRAPTGQTPSSCSQSIGCALHVNGQLPVSSPRAADVASVPEHPYVAIPPRHSHSICFRSGPCRSGCRLWCRLCIAFDAQIATRRHVLAELLQRRNALGAGTVRPDTSSDPRGCEWKIGEGKMEALAFGETYARADAHKVADGARNRRHGVCVNATEGRRCLGRAPKSGEEGRVRCKT